MTERAKQLIQRARMLQTRRGMWSSHWEDVVRVELPRRLGFVTSVIEGARRQEDLYDSTAIVSARGLANAMGGQVRPEGRPWFFIKTVEDADSRTDEAKDWLADSEDRMRRAFENPKSRFKQATGEIDIDMIVLGTAPGFIGENIARGHLTFKSLHLKDALPVYGEDGNLEGMFFFRKLPIRQIMNKPGWTFSEEIRTKIRDSATESNKLDDKVELLFVAIPREEGRVGAKLARNLPIADLVIEVQTRHEVFTGGFHELPYIAPRWDTTSGEDYGRSPGMTALPDANTSNAIGETMLIAGQRAADPPLLTPSDAFIDPPNTFPGGLAFYEADAVQDLGANPITPLEPGRNFPLTREIQQDVREQIRIAFLRNVFNLPVPGEAEMTATEIIARQQEFLREIGPVFGRWEADYTAPLVERSFNIMLRGGGFAPIPPALQGRGIRFEYESPVKRIREQAEAVAAMTWARDLAELEQVKPGITDNIDGDGLARVMARGQGVPSEAIAREDQMAAERQARAQAQQQAEQNEAISGLVESADVAASAMQKAGLVNQPGATGE